MRGFPGVAIAIDASAIFPQTPASALGVRNPDAEQIRGVNRAPVRRTATLLQCGGRRSIMEIIHLR